MIQIENNFLKESFDFEKVAQQASGSVWYQNGGTVILASVAVDEDKVVEEDFLPLTVQYIEKAYANAKFPSGFLKRESKPSDFETLTSRIIDRTLRPLFPEGYAHPTQISVIVLSYDGELDLQVCALNAASSALFTSSIPIEYPVCAVRIGRDENGFVINPNIKELESGSLDLYVSGYDQDLLMIEMRSLALDGEMKELSEDELCEAIELAKNTIAKISNDYRENFAPFKKQTFTFQVINKPSTEEIERYIQSSFAKELRESILQMAKSERMIALQNLAKTIFQVQTFGWEFSLILEALKNRKRVMLREMILKEGVRADYRGLKEVRPINIETNILPFAHGSCLFKRGQTQALVVSTIGGDNDAQSYELLGDKTSSKERFMVHYNFPGFSVGEASMIGAPGRRELGHGNLAKRALESSVNDKRVVRLVSEILESNGSSSMATICGGSLALKASGVQTQKLVAGVAMGLIKEGDSYAILTDIMGLEDHEGDMDFKIAGTFDGVSAMQMDIKLGGVSPKILRESIFQAKEARDHILNLMLEAEKKIVINEEIVPISISFEIDPERIVEVIGQGGKVIKEIIEKFSVSIDLDRSSGEVRVSGIGLNKLQECKEYILDLLQKCKGGAGDLRNYSVGEELVGVVKKIVDFGAFIEMPRGGDGLLHISKIKNQISTLKEGERIEVRVLATEKNRIELDLK